MPFQLGIKIWKIMSFRWRPSSWMQFSILHLKSSIAWANSWWSIVSTSCRMASFNSFKLRGLWVYTRPFRYPQRKKSHDDKHVPWAPHFAFRRCAMAPKVSWLVIMWFLPLGVREGPCVHSQSPSFEWVEGCHLARSAHDRSPAVSPSDGRFQVEDWKLHSRGWSSPKWYYFSYLNT